MAAWPDDVKGIAWAAERLSISPSTAYRLAEKGQLPGALTAIEGDPGIGKSILLYHSH